MFDHPDDADGWGDVVGGRLFRRRPAGHQHGADAGLLRRGRDDPSPAGGELGAGGVGPAHGVADVVGDVRDGGHTHDQAAGHPRRQTAVPGGEHPAEGDCSGVGVTRVGWCPGGRTVAEMLAMYPNTQAVRIFYGPGDGLPAGDWTNPRKQIAQAPQGAVVIVSHKDQAVDAAAFVDAWQAYRPDLLLVLVA